MFNLYDWRVDWVKKRLHQSVYDIGGVDASGRTSGEHVVVVRRETHTFERTDILARLISSPQIIKNAISQVNFQHVVVQKPDGEPIPAGETVHSWYAYEDDVE